MTELLDRITTKIELGDECWVWTGAKDEKGYARIGVSGRNRRAHRVLYEKVVGPIPDGLVLDHLCRNPSCVNPDHLEPVTQSENVKRGDLWQRRRMTCPRGHEYDHVVESTGERICKKCQSAASRRSYLKKRGW